MSLATVPRAHWRDGPGRCPACKETMREGAGRSSRLPERSAEADDPLDFLEAKRPMRGNAVDVRELCVAGDFVMAGVTHMRLGRLHESATDSATAERGIDVPALDERHRRGLAAFGVVPEPQLEKPDEPDVDLRHEDDEWRHLCVEERACLTIVVAERARPQRVAHTEPLIAIARLGWADGDGRRMCLREHDL